MTSNNEYLRSKPIPPPNLSKENVGVWTGWCCKGDREVSREAAAKGLHVDLVILFLSLRKKLTLVEAEAYFRNEVTLWVKELLDRRQIFRVCHVLRNIGMLPETELTRVFYSTANKELREYIGNHLKNQEQLNDNMKQLWHFLDLILRNNILISKFKLSEESLECLDKKDVQWKSEIAAKLFLRTYDILLLPYLSGEAIWKQLLLYNDIKLLKVWINIKYHENHGGNDISNNLQSIFEIFSITNDMINQLDLIDTSLNTSNVVLNELSKFGIFSDNDLNSLLSILSRLHQSDNIQNIFEIIKKSTCNISESTFFILLIDYCLKNNLFCVLSVCVENFYITDLEVSDSADFDLLIDFRKLTKNFNEIFLRDNIFKVAKFFNEDLDNYFCENSLILLSIIYFTDMKFAQILKEKSLNLLGVQLTESVCKITKNLRTVDAVYKRKNIIEKNRLTYYDLLEKHMNIDVKNLYAFQFNSDPLPHFSSPDLVENYGYSKQLMYLFFVKELRPSIATKLFYISQYKNHSRLSEESIKCLQKKIYKIALRKFYCEELTSSCVSFLEMIGINSSFLKVAIKIANILFQENNEHSVIKLFMNIQNDPLAILNDLERNIIEKIDFFSFTDGASFIEAVERYDIVITFTVLYNLKLPEMFLRSCANNNMWLPFLTMAQIRNYPAEQIKPMLQSFKNPNLLEHINHSVVHDIQIDDQNVLMRERDSRKSFLSRIGVRKSLENLNQSESVYSSITSQSSYGSNTSSAGSDFLEIDISNTKATLLQTLIRCHNSTDPPRALLQACQLYRNPLLAIFATSYEPDSDITNWLTWLAVSSELYQTFTNFDSVAVCAQSVTNLLNNCMKHRYPKVILESFEIFIPDNPLKHFVDFLYMVIKKYADIPTLTAKLEAFKATLSRCRRYSVLSENDHEMIYLTNKTWIESTALLLLASALEYNVDSLYEQIQMLKILCEVKIENYIKCSTISNLVEILVNIYNSKSNIRFNITQFFDTKSGHKAVVDCINALLQCDLFEYALQIAKVECLPLDLILIRQWQYNYVNRNHDDVDFWQNSNEHFRLHNITADCVVEFYTNYIDTVPTNLEKYQLLKLAHDWAKNFELSNKYVLERKKWLAYIALEEKWKVTDKEVTKDILFGLTLKEMFEMLKQVATCEEDVSPESSNLIKSIINDALNSGNFWLALKLEKMFNCCTPDLDILKLCYSLAEGLLLPYQLNAKQRLLLTQGTNFRRLNHRRTLLSTRLSSFSSGSHSPANISYIHTSDNVDVPVQDTLSVLCALAEKLVNGSDMGYTVFMTYRISINIEIPYHVIVSNSDSMNMLKDALEDDCMNKLEVVHDFISVYKWSKQQIADFICEEVINSATKYVKSKSDQFLMWDLKLDQDYHLIFQLLQENCSLLGYKIYSYASTMHKTQMIADFDFKISKLALIVELLVTAHDCFTADCNMEGISIILKKCRTVISHLLTLRSWKLIVRLLTGVARYTEMSYVFQILKENDQFEFLLRKGSRKDSGLKTALLEYLKKYCPDNRELYKIVALHFTLFSEVALLWEREAQSIVKNLIAISKLEMQNNKLNPDTAPYIQFSNTDGTRICLNKAIENYTHATEFHLQGEKLAKAMNSAKQAELIALQISLLKGLQNNGSAVCLLHLNKAQISGLISDQLSFDQSLILTEAYNYQPDWSTVLFEQCILKSNLSYLEVFLKHRSLTDGLVHDISRKFLSANINTLAEMSNMKKILTKLPSVHSKYRIASELGFMDIVEELIRGGQLAYLKDTVWKKGYKS